MESLITVFIFLDVYFSEQSAVCHFSVRSWNLFHSSFSHCRCSSSLVLVLNSFSISQSSWMRSTLITSSWSIFRIFASVTPSFQVLDFKFSFRFTSIPFLLIFRRLSPVFFMSIFRFSPAAAPVNHSARLQFQVLHLSVFHFFFGFRFWPCWPWKFYVSIVMFFQVFLQSSRRCSSSFSSCVSSSFRSCPGGVAF